MITLATFPRESVYGPPMVPSLVRLLPGPGLPGQLAAAGMANPQNIQKFMKGDWDRVFGITPGVGALPFVVVVINRTAPPGFGPGDQEDYQAVRVYSSEDLKEMKVDDPAWRARNKLLWLIFDLLDVERGEILEEAATRLRIPEVWKQSTLDRVYANPEYKKLRIKLEKLRSLGPDVASGEPYMDLVRDALFSDVQLARRTLSKIINHTQAKRPETAFLHTFHRPFNYKHRMHSEAVPGGIRWQVTTHGPIKRVVGESTEGPLEAMLDAGLIIEAEQLEPWLDRNVEEGKLLYDPEPYDLLNSNPLLWDNAEFEAWGKQMGLDV